MEEVCRLKGLLTQHSALSTQHSTLNTQHSIIWHAGHRNARSKFGAVQYSAGSPLSAGMIVLILLAPVAGMFIQCLRMVPYMSRKSVDRNGPAACEYWVFPSLSE